MFEYLWPGQGQRLFRITAIILVPLIALAVGFTW
jgi:hypothetical protein